jgi:hypothetical protein
MSVHIANVTSDCDDPRVVAGLWSAALGRPVDEGASEFFASIDRSDDSRKGNALHQGARGQGGQEPRAPRPARR